MARGDNLGEQVYTSLKRKIMNNELLPNTYLDEVRICAELGVSRTPVREALVRLEGEGMVVSLPKRGMIVSDLSMGAILELLHIRKVMEPELIRPYMKNYSRETLESFRKRFRETLKKPNADAANQLDYEFHTYLYEGCGKPHVTRLLAYVCDQCQRIRTKNRVDTARLKEGIEEHLEMIRALQEERYDDMTELLRAHIASVEDFYHKIFMDDISSYR